MYLKYLLLCRVWIDKRKMRFMVDVIVVHLFGNYVHMCACGNAALGSLAGATAAIHSRT